MKFWLFIFAAILLAGCGQGHSEHDGHNHDSGEAHEHHEGDGHDHGSEKRNKSEETSK